MDIHRIITGYKKLLSVSFIDMELSMSIVLNIVKMELYENILRECDQSFSKTEHSFLNKNE